MVLDVQYGNIWTNIPGELIHKIAKSGDLMHVSIYHDKQKVYEGNMPYATTFGDVAEGKPILYLNSLLQVAVALNLRNFSTVHKVYSGNDWHLIVEKKR